MQSTCAAFNHSSLSVSWMMLQELVACLNLLIHLVRSASISKALSNSCSWTDTWGTQGQDVPTVSRLLLSQFFPSLFQYDLVLVSLLHITALRFCISGKSLADGWWFLLPFGPQVLVLLHHERRKDWRKGTAEVLLQIHEIKVAGQASTSSTISRTLSAAYQAAHGSAEGRAKLRLWHEIEGTWRHTKAIQLPDSLEKQQ